ncbi:MAG: CRISPR system precrRNA processing endoribonuclease RAMP protein Cas6 [Bryobacteraceae bacterium]|nr:CRISPR system precrRNA processing endoribonuclease RAMP protein Cas6 [Bryobacteraceae bacterium]
MDLKVLPLRFTLRTIDPLRFPPSGPANALRGMLGLALRAAACIPDCPSPALCPQRRTCPYARLFEPLPQNLPPGFRNPPRPYVIRTLELGSRTLQPGEPWSFDLYLFDTRPPDLAGPLLASLRAVSQEGLGLGRGRAELIRVEVLDCGAQPAHALETAVEPRILTLPLEPLRGPVRRIRVRYVTPTELKQAGQIAPEADFSVLFARLRDRVSTLRTLYGDGPLPVDFHAMGLRATAIRLVRSDLAAVRASRRSSRTGQVHPLGGFTGEAEYEGDLGEFLPFLRAGWWTGVGRQTVWGKGAIETEVLDPRP